MNRNRRAGGAGDVDVAFQGDIKTALDRPGMFAAIYNSVGRLISDDFGDVTNEAGREMNDDPKSPVKVGIYQSPAGQIAALINRPTRQALVMFYSEYLETVAKW